MNSPHNPFHARLLRKTHSTYSTCACRTAGRTCSVGGQHQGPGTRDQGGRSQVQGGSQGRTATRHTNPGLVCTNVSCACLAYPLTHTLAGLTGGRINSTHGPERGSLHFNCCGCAGLGASQRQCGTASGRDRARQPRRVTTPPRVRPRGGSSSSSSTSVSNCHLPLPTSTATPPPPRPSPTPTQTSPTLPTAGNHAPR